MPDPPYARLLVRINGGAPTGSLEIALNDTVQLVAESTVGWDLATVPPIWEIFGFPPAFSCPAGWSSVTVEGTTVYRFVGVGPPPSFTADLWGKYMLALHVNGGGGQLTDRTTAVSIVSPRGFRDLGRHEAAQFGGALDLWTRDHRANLRVMEDIADAAVPVLTSSPPANVTRAAASAGVSGEVARADHKHDIATAAPGAVTCGSLSSEGSSSAMARADHIHPTARGTPVPIGTSLSSGSSNDFAAADHVHTLDIFPAQAIALQSDERICLLGTSIFAGDNASQDTATGPREAFWQFVRAYRGAVQLVGPHGYGATDGTGTTWGRFRSLEEWHNPEAPPPLGSWAHHGELGRKMTASFTVTGVDAGTDTITATGHDLGDGSILVLSSTGALPTIAAVKSYYFARDVVAGVSFKLAAYEGGPALDITAPGSGTITVGTGLAELVPATLPGLDPTTIIVHAGTNDISELIDNATLDPLSVLQTRAVALRDAIAAAAPNAKRILWSSIHGFYQGATSYAAKATLAGDFNTWLASAVGGWSGNRWAYVDGAAGISAPLIKSDGVHLRRDGNIRLAKNLAEGFRRATMAAAPPGPVPRPFAKRTSQPVLNVGATTHRVAIPDQASIRPGSSNYLFSIDVRPTILDVAVTPFSILGQNVSYTDGYMLAHIGNNLLFYWRQGGAVVPSSSYTNVLTQLAWHRIVGVVDHDADQIGLFLNGSLIQIVNFAGQTISVQEPLYIGSVPGFSAMLGQYSRLVLARGSHITIANALEMVERDYYDGVPFPGIVEHFPLNEGTGTSVASTVAGSTAGTITGATWAKAGLYPLPWEDGIQHGKRMNRGSVAYASPTVDQLADGLPGIPGAVHRVSGTGAGTLPINLPPASKHDNETVAILTSSDGSAQVIPDGTDTITGVDTVDLDRFVVFRAYGPLNTWVRVSSVNL